MNILETDEAMTAPHIQWAMHTLNALGYSLLHPRPETILATAWSEVTRFQTSQGFVYLKKVPPSLALEASVIQMLQKQFQANVPTLLAQNAKQHCFLMIDAGISLQEYFKQAFIPDVLIDTLQRYTQLQINISSHIDLFLSLGVPDWRLERIPSLYRQLLTEERLLLEDGLSKEELKSAQHLEHKVQIVCSQLAQYNIPDTFGHADFHNRNILIDPETKQTTLIDLGEVVITHPFISFVNCLEQTTEHLKLPEEQDKKLQEDCFKHWLPFESSEHLFEIISLIKNFWPIHAVLGEYRLLQSVAPEDRVTLQRQGRFAKKLKIWITQSMFIK